MESPAETNACLESVYGNDNDDHPTFSSSRMPSNWCGGHLHQSDCAYLNKMWNLCYVRTYPEFEFHLFFMPARSIHVVWIILMLLNICWTVTRLVCLSNITSWMAIQWIGLSKKKEHMVLIINYNGILVHVIFNKLCELCEIIRQYIPICFCFLFFLKTNIKYCNYKTNYPSQIPMC